jgi:hypothetical protein
LIQILYSVRGERLQMEEIDYSMLYRWFVVHESRRASLVGDGIHEESQSAIGSRRGARVSG